MKHSRCSTKVSIPLLLHPPPCRRHTHTRMICGPRRRRSLLIQFSPPSGWACLPQCRDARARSATEIDDHEWPKRNGRDVLETTRTDADALIYIRRRRQVGRRRHIVNYVKNGHLVALNPPFLLLRYGMGMKYCIQLLGNNSLYLLDLISRPNQETSLEAVFCGVPRWGCFYGSHFIFARGRHSSLLG